MKRSALRFSLALLALLLAPAAAQAQDAAANGDKHMLWKVSSNDGTTEGYLVGSIHLMKPDAYPLDTAFDEAFDEADLLVFEADYDSMAAQAQQLTMQLALYPEGQTLQTELSEETYAALEERAQELGLNLAQMQRLEPWMVGLMIPVMQMQQAGYNPQAGIDAHFFGQAKEAGKERRAFETPAYQLGLFDELPPEEQEAFLRYGLEEAEENVAMIDEMVAYWKSGNAEALERLMQDEMQEEFPALYEKLLVERNENWMPEIITLLEAEPQPMIVVGAGHVVGEEGLAAMLEAEGYTVEQQ